MCDEFFSGQGSHEKKLVSEYSNFIKKFIKNNHVKTVVDIGCGDFNIGQNLVDDSIQYIGVDIVPELIERNNAKYGKRNVTFIAMDIVENCGPEGDLCLIKEVLQHLSNEEIMKVIHNIKNYKYVLISESVLRKELAGNRFNVDKPHGNCFGIYLEEEPFNLKVETVLKRPYPGKEEDMDFIVSLLIKEYGG